MSKSGIPIVEDVAKVISNVADAIGDVASGALDAVGDVLEFAVDEVIQPVFGAVEDTIEGFLDDPLMTVARIAAIASNTWWALPLVEGANTAIAGGDLDDVLKTMAISAVSQQAGDFAGSKLAEYGARVSTSLQYGTDVFSDQTKALLAQDVGFNVVSDVASAALGAAGGSAARALVLGGDPLDAASMALVNSLGNAITTNLAGTSSSFNKLSDASQKTITDTAVAIASGGDPTMALVSGIVRGLSPDASAGEKEQATQEVSKLQEFVNDVSDVTSNVLSSIGLETPEQQAVVTGAISNAFAAAFTGGNVSSSIDAYFAQKAARQIGDVVKKYGTETYNNIKDAYDRAVAAGDEIDSLSDARQLVVDAYEAYKTDIELEAAILEDDRNKAQYYLEKYNDMVATSEAKTATAQSKIDTYNEMVATGQAKSDAAKAVIDTYNSRVTKYNSLLKTAQDKIDAFNADRTSQSAYDAAIAARDAAAAYKRDSVDKYYNDNAYKITDANDYQDEIAAYYKEWEPTVIDAQDYAKETQDYYDKWEPTVTAAMEATNDFNDKLAEGGEYYKVLEGYKESVDTFDGKIEDQITIYDAANTLFQDSYDFLGIINDEAVSAAKTVIVDTVTGGQFDAEEYAKNASTSDYTVTAEEAVDHFIEVGQYAGISVNAEQEAKAWTQAADLAVNRALEGTGLTMADLDVNTIKSIRSELEKSFSTANSLLVATDNDNFLNSLGSSITTSYDNWADAVNQQAAEWHTNYVMNAEAGELLNESVRKNTGVTITAAEGVDMADVVNNPDAFTSSVNADTGQLEWVPTEDYTPMVYNPTTGASEATSLYNIDGQTTRVAIREDERVDKLYITLDGSNPGTTVAKDDTGAFREYDTATGQFSESAPFDSFKAAGVANIPDEAIYDFIVDAYEALEAAGEVIGDVADAVYENTPAGKIANAVDEIWDGLEVGDKAVKLVNDALTWAEETGQDPKTSDWVRDTLGIVIAGGGELLEAYVTAFDVLSDEGASPEMLALAERMVKVGADVHSEEYKQNLAEMQEIMGQEVDPNAPWWEQAAQVGMNIFDAASEHPLTFMSEYVLTEIVQEIPTVLTFGAGKVLTVGAKAVGYTDDVAKWIGRTGALSAEVVMEASEAFGGTYKNAHEQIYNEAKGMGMSDADALALAEEGAINSAWTATGAAMASMGVGGLAIEKVLLDKKVPSTTMAGVWDKIGERTSTIIKASAKESVAEALEEGFTEYTTGSFIKSRVNPDYNIIESTAQSAILGALAGGATSASMGTVGTIFGAAAYSPEVPDNFSPINNVLKTYSPTYNATLDAAVATGDPAEVKQVLDIYGVQDENVRTEILNQSYDEYYQTAAEVYENTQNQYGYFDFNSDEVQQFVGEYSDADTAAAMDAYVDPRYMDADEVRRAAAQEGVNLTQAQAEELAKQGDQTELMQAIQRDYDSYGVTRQEIIDRYAELGYTPTAAEINEYAPTDISNLPSPNKINSAAVGLLGEAARTDPRYDVNGDGKVTSADALKVLKYQQGILDPYTDASLEFLAANNLISQPGVTADNQSEIFNAVEAYVDPRQVTLDEVKEQFAATIPDFDTTGIDLEYYTGQRDEAQAFADIDKYVDENYVDTEEARAALEAYGFTNPTDSMIRSVMGQQVEAELDNTIADNEVQILYSALREGGLSSDLAARFSGLEDAIADSTSALRDDLTATIQKYEKEGASRDEAIQKAVDDLAADLGTTKDDIMGLIGSPATDDTEATGIYNELANIKTAISDTEQRVLDKMQEYEDAGIARDEALQKAIDDVAADLGTTAENLANDIGDLANNLADTEQAILDRVAEYERAGMDRDEALAKAIEDVASDLNTSTTELANQIGVRAVEDDPRTIEDESQASTGIYKYLDEQSAAMSDALTDATTALGEQITGVETDLSGQISATEAALQREIDEVAAVLGKPPQQVTQAEFDYVRQWIAESQAATEQNPYVLNEYQQGYDLDNDGQITDVDLQIMEILQNSPQAIAEVAPNSRYGQRNTMADYATQLAADQQYALEVAQQQNLEQQQQMEQNLQEQMEQNLETTLTNQEYLTQGINLQNDWNWLMGQIMNAPDAGGRRVTVNTPDPAKINYIYDFNSIFANPQQASLMPTPYAKGGTVGDDDELYKLLGAN